MENKISASNKRTFMFFLICLAAMFLWAFPLFASDAEKIQLDADKITFEDGTGVATAEGNVRISNSDVRLFAPYVEYDSVSHHIRATSSSEGSVTFLTKEGRLNAERLDYNMTTRQGTLLRPNGKVDNFYVKGESLEVKPAPEIPGRKKSGENDEQEDMSAEWSAATITTCDEAHPHYRFEAKSITVVPGRSLTIGKPKVYLGETMIMSYPFDYVIRMGEHTRRNKRTIFPKLGYESKKGVGLGLEGVVGWDTGDIGFGVTGWSDNIWEFESLLTQDITPDLTAYASGKRLYDKDRDVTSWRPAWGLDYRKNGWIAQIGWSQRELVYAEKRAGRDTRYVVWKEPEVNVVTPWFEDRAIGGYFRLLGTWGRYEDATHGPSPTIERRGLGAQVYGEFQNNREVLRPFYNAVYWHYNYDTPQDDSHRILDAVLGFRYSLGKFDMETAYLRRWSWGHSPMGWDQYDPREEIYHEIGYTIPTNSRKISWRLGVRGAYDIIDEELAEMVYKVGYDMHCMLWEGVYRDDRQGDDNWFGLKLTIKAYPSSGLRLSGSELFEPAKAPDELVHTINYE